MCNKVVLIALLPGVVTALGYKYELQIRDEEVFKPCPDYPDNFIDKFVTMPSNLTLLPDDRLYIAGDLEIIHDFQPTVKYEMILEFFKLERGKWQETIYTVKREDFCTSFFNPKELWGPFVRNIPAAMRSCPLKKAQKFSVNYTTEQEFELPSGSMEGDYWMRSTLFDKHKTTFSCFDSYFTLYRI